MQYVVRRLSSVLVSFQKGECLAGGLLLVRSELFYIMDVLLVCSYSVPLVFNRGGPMLSGSEIRSIYMRGHGVDLFVLLQ